VSTVHKMQYSGGYCHCTKKIAWHSVRTAWSREVEQNTSWSI